MRLVYCNQCGPLKERMLERSHIVSGERIDVCSGNIHSFSGKCGNCGCNIGEGDTAYILVFAPDIVPFKKEWVSPFFGKSEFSYRVINQC